MSLTNEQIDQMEAGREMDDLINEKVMGNRKQYGCFIDDGYADDCVTDICDCVIAESLHEEKEKFPDKCQYWREVDPLPYSTDIASAWEVVEKATDYEGFSSDFALDGTPNYHTWKLWFGTRGHCTEGKGSANTVALAICRAGLKAVINS